MQIHGLVNRIRAAFASDAAQKQVRSSSFGEPYVYNAMDSEFVQADGGELFSAINPTPSTGIAQTIQATFLSTNGILTFRNNAASVNKRMYPKLLRLINTVVGTSTTRSEGLISIDNITRYASGGSAITPLVNRNMDDLQVSEGILHFGALTLAAESASIRRVSRFQLRGAIMVQFEEWVLRFGSGDSDPQSLGGATALRTTVNVPAVGLGQGDSMAIHLWNTGNVTTAPSWEFEFAWVER